MPFQQTEGRPLLPLRGLADLDGNEMERPDFWTETIPSAFRTENLIGSAIATELAPQYRVDMYGRPTQFLYEADFDPLDADYLSGYEEYADRFATVLTRQQGEALKNNIDRETADREILARSGIPGFVAALGAGTLDPTVLLPVGGAARRGESLLSLLSRTASAAALGTAVQEAGLMEMQETRTEAERAIAIGGSVVLGGVLGSAAYPFLRSSAGDAAARAMPDDMRLPREGEPDWANPMEAVPVDEPQPAGTYLSADAEGRVRNAFDRLDETVADAEPRARGEGGSVGAERVNLPDIDGQRIASVLARKTGETVRLQDPVLRSITSDSIEARRLVEEVADLPFGLEKNQARYRVRRLEDGREQLYIEWGQPTRVSVESRIKQKGDSMRGALESEKADAYIRYLYGRDRNGIDIAGAGLRSITGTLPQGKMSRPDFMREVTRALRRGDKHEDPHVQQLAQWTRANFLDPLKNEARDLGMFGYDLVRNPDDPDAPPTLRPREPTVGSTAESYLNRLYDRELIKKNRGDFVQRIYDHYVRKREEARRLEAELEEQLEQTKETAQAFYNEARSTLAQRDRQLRDARREVDKAERARQRDTARRSEARTQDAAARRRSDVLDVDTLDPLQRSYWRGFLADVQRGHGRERPVSLLQFIRGIGGLQDVGGDLRAMDAHLRSVVNDKSGIQMDYAIEAAVEAGYLTKVDEQGYLSLPTQDEFLEAIRRELAGKKTFSDAQRQLVEYEEMLEGLQQALEDADLDFRSISVEEFASFMDGKRYASHSRFRDGKLNEALRREEYTGRRVRRAEERVEDAEADEYFARAMARTVRETAPELTEQANEIYKQFRRARTEIKRLRRDLHQQHVRADREDYELRADAETTVDRILGGATGAVDYDGVGVRDARRYQTSNDRPVLSGRFRERKLDIPDEMIEPYLINDLDMLMRSFERSMVPYIEMTRRFGTVTMEPQIAKVRDDYNRLIAEAGDGRRARSLQNQKEKALRDIEGMRDRLLGTYALPDNPDNFWYRVGRSAIALNYLRLMGGVTLSSLPDLPRAIFTHGLSSALGAPLRSFTDKLGALASGKGWASETAGGRVARGLSNELQDAGTAFEIVLNNRVMAMADLMDDFGRGSKMERALGMLQGHFGYASLIAPWNHAAKHIAGFAVQNRILRAAERAADGRISKKDATFLAQMGFNESDAVKLAEQFRRYGFEEGGQRVANSIDWDNAPLRTIWLNALRKEVDRLIVTPGLDKPLVASTPLGQVLLQFRSYNFAATQRVMMAYQQGMSAGDAHAMMALLTQVGMGMMVAALKADQYGLSTEDWTAQRWIVEGVDRAGLLGVLTDVNMMLEHSTRGGVGLSALAGEGRLTRYQTRNALGAYLGPTFGGAQDLLTGGSALLGSVVGDSELRESDIHALRRILPFNNLFWLRERFDDLEKAAAVALDAEDVESDRGAFVR